MMSRGDQIIMLDAAFERACAAVTERLSGGRWTVVRGEVVAARGNVMADVEIDIEQEDEE